MLSDAVSMTRAAGERAEDEHIESSGEDIVSHRLSMEAQGDTGVKDFPSAGGGGAVRPQICGRDCRSIPRGGGCGGLRGRWRLAGGCLRWVGGRLWGWAYWPWCVV